ncbi:MAG: YdbL family protein [Gammaproteobacteria bacterium]|nr:YdbL family protein [Gammaproteobacteria bacterium]
MKKILILLTTCLLLMAQNAYSIDLQSAKQQGLVGETPDGYLAAVKSPSAEINALIQSVNAERKKKYEKIASRNKITLHDVEQLAGKKAIEKTKAGDYIKLGGSWQKK